VRNQISVIWQKPAKDARDQKSPRKSHAFKILTCKVFVMNILQKISPVVAAKLLIPDILQKNRGEGGR
jgi:hypothetical protein